MATYPFCIPGKKVPAPASRNRRPARRLCPAALTLILAACIAACATAPPTASGASSGKSTAGPATSGPVTPTATGAGTRSPLPPRAHRRPLAGKVVVIDPGHNGGNAAHAAQINRLVNVITEWKPCDTTGTQTGSGYTEHAFTFSVARRLARLLRREGATVILTRHNDHGVGPCITERAQIANRAHADVAISIHADGGPPSGTGFQVLEPGLVPGHTNAIVGPSRRLGLDIRSAYRRATGEPYSSYLGWRGILVRTDLGGLNLSRVPKVFIECANMRNPGDAARLENPAFRRRIAAGLAAGLTAFLAHGRA